MRRAGDGTVPVPGWTADHEWDGWIPAEELPWSKDPARGFLATANNRIHDDAYPHLIGHDFHTPFRARRIVERPRGDDRARSSDMAGCRTTRCRSPPGRPLPLLTALEPHTDAAARRAGSAPRVGRRHGGRLRAGRRLQRRGRATSPGACWCRGSARTCSATTTRGGSSSSARPCRRCFASPEGWLDDDLLRAALDDALEELRETLGDDPDGWRWGALHRLRLAHPLASIPGLEPLFLAADVELGGDEQTVMQGGFDGRDGYPAAVIPSWRAVYDLADLDRSVGVLPAGHQRQPRDTALERPDRAVARRAIHIRCPSPRRPSSAATVCDTAPPPRVTSFAMPKSRGRTKKKEPRKYGAAPTPQEAPQDAAPAWYGAAVLVVMGLGVHRRSS